MVAELILLTAFAGIIRAASGALGERDPTSRTPPAPVDLAKVSNDRTIKVINSNPDIPELNRMRLALARIPAGYDSDCHKDGQDWCGRCWRRPSASDGPLAVKSLK